MEMTGNSVLDLSCKGCGAALRVESHMKTANCPYCGSPSVVERPESEDRPDPNFVIGFVIEQERAIQLINQWISSRSIFTRSDFKRAAVKAVRSVYLPAYLYSAIAHSEYTARIGENYTVTYTTTVNGKTVTRTRTETEWRNLAGRHGAYVTDVIVTASRGIDNAALEGIEPFDLRTLRRYDPGIISGWAAEEPSMTRESCQELAHAETLDKVGHMLAGFMPGDSHRNLDHQTSVVDESAELVLLPVWSCVVRISEKEKPIRLLLNGQTGQVAGRVPISWMKILGAIAIVLFVILAIIVGIGSGM